jgi:hypothetical protein
MRSNLVLCHQETHRWWWKTACIWVDFGWPIERELHLGLLRDALRLWGARAIAKFFVRLPCARSNAFLDHKSSSSSTTTWITERSTRRSLLLRVCVHPQLHFIRQQLLQYTALLPRAPRIETEATLRDNCNCKLFVLFLSVTAFFSQYVCFVCRDNLGLITMLSSNSTWKIRHNLLKMQYLIMASMWSNYMIWKDVFLLFLEVREGYWGRSLFGSFATVGSQIRQDNWTLSLSKLWHQ